MWIWKGVRDWYIRVKMRVPEGGARWDVEEDQHARVDVHWGLLGTHGGTVSTVEKKKRKKAMKKNEEDNAKRKNKKKGSPEEDKNRRKRKKTSEYGVDARSVLQTHAPGATRRPLLRALCNHSLDSAKKERARGKEGLHTSSPESEGNLCRI